MNKTIGINCHSLYIQKVNPVIQRQ